MKKVIIVIVLLLLTGCVKNEPEIIEQEEIKEEVIEEKYIDNNPITVGIYENDIIYNYIDDNMPEWARPTIEKLVKKGLLDGNGSELNLNTLMLRILVINDRAGLYD